MYSNEEFFMISQPKIKPLAWLNYPRLDYSMQREKNWRTKGNPLNSIQE
mgnify:CR=1 FL=1|jgi:hypothetical protein